MPFAHLLDRHDVETNKKCISVGAKQPECVVSVISDTSGELSSSSQKPGYPELSALSATKQSRENAVRISMPFLSRTTQNLQIISTDINTLSSSIFGHICTFISMVLPTE